MKNIKEIKEDILKQESLDKAFQMLMNNVILMNLESHNLFGIKVRRYSDFFIYNFIKNVKSSLISIYGKESVNKKLEEIEKGSKTSL